MSRRRPLESCGVEDHQQLPDRLTVLDLGQGLLDVCKQGSVRHDELLASSQAAAVASVSKNVDLAPAKVPRSLERVGALLKRPAWYSRLRSAAWCSRLKSAAWCSRLRSAGVVVCMVVVGQEVLVLEDAAARHWVGARPRREHDGFQQRVLLGVLFHSGALKAIDGRDADVVEDDLLGVAPGESIMRLEEEDRR